MKDFQNKVAVITGAGSGIGRALARDLAAAGARLALSDVNQVGLQETADSLGLGSDRLITEAFDVADRDAVYAFADRVAGHFGAAHLVINNAGVALGATVEDMSYDDFEWLMGINFWGVVYGTKAFLPYLKQSGDGHIVNISSIFGIIGVPTQSAYNAAKFAVKGFTESLREELDIEGSSVSATCVHPGGVKTAIARNSRMGDTGSLTLGSKEEIAELFERIARTTPEQAANVILQGVRKNQRRVLIGADAVLLDIGQRLMPTGYQRLLETFFNRREGKENALRESL